MRIRFWGVRGTIPTPGPNTVRYGGNTACLDILTSNGHVIILDAGTGIRALGETLLKEYPQKLTGWIFLSHTHWDHIQGLPFFAPLQSRKNRFHLIGQKRTNIHLERIISRQFLEPYMPFAYSSLAAGLRVSEMVDGETIVIDDHTSVKVTELNHPGGCIGFRIQDHEAVFAYCTDTGRVGGKIVNSLVQLADRADLLIHDSFFANIDKSKTFSDWGHSCWVDAARIAAKANVKNLGLFHYAPDLTDDTLEEMRANAREIFARTFLTREGMTVELPIGLLLPE